MKVFFTCSTREIKKYSKEYKTIRDEIISLGHEINRDWIDYSINAATRGTPDTPSHTLYKDVMSAILTADAIILDATVKSMALGQQLTYAMQKSKPVLVIRKKTTTEKEKKLFVEGSEVQELLIREYNNITEAKKFIKEFLKKYADKSMKRFNLVLPGALENYISWASFNYRRTKTEIIQEAIDKMIEKDISYRKYLDRQS